MTKEKNTGKSWKEKRRQAVLKRQKAAEAERIRKEREPKKKKGWSRSKALGIVFLLLIVLVTGVYAVWQGRIDNNSQAPTPSTNIVLFTTNMGDIKIELYDDMPITTKNFKELVQEGVYDDTIFHRVIDGFMIQGGDPTGTGYGAPDIPTIPDEFSDHNENNRGTIAMANSGPNTGSSQFFINLVDNNYLDTKHPVFGRVIEGMDVVDDIGKVETDENDRPLQDVKIEKAQFLND